jgi:hypothetical protein
VLVLIDDPSQDHEKNLPLRIHDQPDFHYELDQEPTLVKEHHSAYTFRQVSVVKRLSELVEDLSILVNWLVFVRDQVNHLHSDQIGVFVLK